MIVFIMSTMNDIVKKAEPRYKALISRFSPSYLSGSDWYVGESLVDWWFQRNLEVLNIKENYKKVYYILETILRDENKIS